ncbi:SPOR domain-containing protein [Paenibacillus sp. VCA1]|uniref:SPOR domain-containing protein n=1 Tax=Paenibacillus sp. VCA1 TaxID=3039148 RepID=UPI002870C198|nr:SPOR domain-containing protein [Paenibacillus sp. VCA1]MDR9857282.1 SPOR domain-containing protein [Paenibacillus sp. VCA1]
MTVNKARMTFRFNQENPREPDAPQEEKKPAAQTFKPMPEKERAPKKSAIVEPPRQEHQQDVPGKNRDHLHVVSGSMQGWSDPFHKDEPWDELLSGWPRDDRKEERRRDRPEDAEFHDFEAGRSGEWRDLADDIYPERGEISYRPRRPTSLWKMIGTITGAVVTGALFGFVILTFFKDGSGGANVPVKPVSENAAKSTAGQAQAAPVAVSIKGESYYMLQYGVFSSGERAEQAKKELEQYGIAAGIDPDQKSRVYAGISADREQAKLLSSQLKSQGVELYVKEITIPAVSELKFAGDADTARRYFETSSELASKLSRLSAALLSKEKATALNEGDEAAITDVHSRWTEAIKSFQTGLGQEEEQLGAQIEQTMNSAVSALTEYKRNANKSLLWEVQSRIMQYVMQQKELISRLGKA